MAKAFPSEEEDKRTGQEQGILQEKCKLLFLPFYTSWSKALALAFIFFLLLFYKYTQCVVFIRLYAV